MVFGAGPARQRLKLETQIGNFMLMLQVFVAQFLDARACQYTAVAMWLLQ